MNRETGERTNFEAFKFFAHDDKNVWRIYEPKLKNATQQKRVELIEKQKNELIAATATINNQAATIKNFENSFEIKNRTIKIQCFDTPANSIHNVTHRA